jgi:hypothetical protein
MKETFDRKTKKGVVRSRLVELAVDVTLITLGLGAML